MLIPYTVVYTQGTNERERVPKGDKWEGSEGGIYIRSTFSGSGEGGNGEAVALAEILMNNGNTGVSGLYGILGSDLGLNPAQLTAARAMGTEK